VRVWDEAGLVSGWSEPGWFEVELDRTDGWHSGIIIALAVNSSTDAANDELGALAVSVYQTLQKAGRRSTPGLKRWLAPRTSRPPRRAR